MPGLSEFTVIALISLSGFCLLGLQFGIIGSEANVFPTYIRSWGVGSCFAAARVGSALGPVIAGILIGMQVSTRDLFLFATIPLIIGLVATAILTPMYNARVFRSQEAASADRLAPAE
jgi:MFS transporter, AAHS family, 4-hydroxybenzoate transporter